MKKLKTSATERVPAPASPCSAFDRWTADGDEDAKRMAWDAGRAPLLAALREIHEIATRHKRVSDLKTYLLADLESIERRSSPNDRTQRLADERRRVRLSGSANLWRVTVNDGICSWTYEIAGTDQVSIRQVMNAVTRRLKGKLVREWSGEGADSPNVPSSATREEKP